MPANNQTFAYYAATDQATFLASALANQALCTAAILANTAGYVYLDAAGLALYIDSRLLVQLTTDSQLTNPDTYTPGAAVLAACERAAARRIDNALRWCYAVPLAGSDLTDEILAIDASLTLYALFERRATIPSWVQKRYDQAVARLVDMGSAKPDERRKNYTTPKARQGD
jgi:hypothetical protein